MAVVSFGNTAMVESALSGDLGKTVAAIDALSLGTTSEQTDIGDGLYTAESQLAGATDGNKKIIIMLTDGVPNEPVQKGDNNYPAVYAQSVAANLEASGTSLYTIGLGKDVDAGFLQSLVPDNSHYFFAPTKADLSSIYNEISSALCVKKPSVVIVLYRIL